MTLPERRGGCDQREQTERSSADTASVPTNNRHKNPQETATNPAVQCYSVHIGGSVSSLSIKDSSIITGCKYVPVFS